MCQIKSLFPLILVAALLTGIASPEVQAGEAAANKPGPDEVILHAGSYFEPSASFRFKIRPGMRQLTAYLGGHHLLNKNFRSIQVGRDVIANIYKARPGAPGAGYGGRQCIHSATGLKPVYSILVVNRKKDGRADRNYVGLPFRVGVTAQWQPFLGAGRLHMDEYFVSQSARHRQVHELSRVLQPQDQGADSIMLYTGRYPTTSMQVVLFAESGARGVNARSFPTDPAYAAGYDLWDKKLNFGDRTRSLRIKWVGPEFDSKGNAGSSGNAGGSNAQGGVVQFVVPDVKGFWKHPLGLRYEIGTNGKHFAWKVAATGERGQGWFLDATRVKLQWAFRNGPMSKPINGRVDRDANWRATKIRFSNGLELARERAADKGANAKSKSSLSGSWNSSFGRVDIQHVGSTIKGTIHYKTGGTASLQGTIQGMTIKVNWLANLQAHGHGTFTISPDGRRLSGPFVDVVSKGKGNWVLTR